MRSQVVAGFTMRVIVALLASAALLFAGQTDYERAKRLYHVTDYEGALKVLLPLADKDAQALAMIGQCYFMTGDFRKSTEFFLKAVSSDPRNSEYYHWLGKAFGRRAETSSVFTAPGYANKARENFERAVALDPRNIEATNDLFEYYLQAPGFLGGGLDKAGSLAQRIGQLDPAEASYAQARIAERRKEFGAAEQQLRRAVDLAPRQVGRVVDLAKFLSKQGRYEESEHAFALAEKMAPENPKVMFERASAYIGAKRNMDQARLLLKRYLKASLTPDDPPREEAAKLLRQAEGG